MANIAHLDTSHVEHAVDSFKLMLPAGRLSGHPQRGLSNPTWWDALPLLVGYDSAHPRLGLTASRAAQICFIQICRYRATQPTESHVILKLQKY